MPTCEECREDITMDDCGIQICACEHPPEDWVEAGISFARLRDKRNRADLEDRLHAELPGPSDQNLRKMVCALVDALREQREEARIFYREAENLRERVAGLIFRLGNKRTA